MFGMRRIISWPSPLNFQGGTKIPHTTTTIGLMGQLLLRASPTDYSYSIYSLSITNSYFCVFGNSCCNILPKSNHQKQGRGKVPFNQVRGRCVLVITKNFQVMGIGLVICWSTSNHPNINFLVLGRGMSNLLEML